MQSMIQSMTGFGKINGTFKDKKVSIEIRSLNSKGLDLNLKLPNTYKELENDIRRMVSEMVSRGKVDIGVYLESENVNFGGTINHALAKKYYKELKSLNEVLGNQPTEYLPLILRLPDVIVQQSIEVEEQEKIWLLELVKECALQLSGFRKNEGEALAKDLKVRTEEIRNLLSEIEQFEGERVKVVRERILKGFNEMKTLQVDENRLEQEMIFYMEKLDVSEEKIRLSNHLDYFLSTMNEHNSGKKLGFIAQEIGREINTLGSKSNHAEMQKRVVNMKDSLEKMKEQLLNIL
jgi:uncharacterized protein (TIGR00255 family)